MHSPSSILDYKQCPRKFFYKYILRLPTKPNIHLVRGGIVHSVLEKFFDLSLEVIQTAGFHKPLLSLFKREWQARHHDLLKLSLAPEEHTFYFEDSSLMLINWANQFSQKVSQLQDQGLDFKMSFNQLKPVEKELRLESKEHGLKGFVDVVEEKDGQLRIMDYKTSKRTQMSESHKLQLALYSLLYQTVHQKKPDEIGIYFLKGNEEVIPVTNDLIEAARLELEQIHLLTQSDSIKDYPKKPGPLCKFRSGQCEFYDVCHRQG